MTLTKKSLLQFKYIELAIQKVCLNYLDYILWRFSPDKKKCLKIDI